MNEAALGALAEQLGTTRQRIQREMDALGVTPNKYGHIDRHARRLLEEALAPRGTTSFRLGTGALQARARGTAGIPAFVRFLVHDAERASSDALPLLRDAFEEEVFIDVRERAVRALSDQWVQRPEQDDIPAPAGAMLLHYPDTLLLLVWRILDDRLSCRLLGVGGPYCTTVESGEAAVLFEGGWGAIDGSLDKSLRILARLPHVLPEPAGRSREHEPEHSTSDHTTTASTRRADDDVRVVYMGQPAGGTGEGLAEFVRREARWTVRGHFRNQWYPSVGEHRRIWIDEHEAGSTDAPVRRRTLVFAVR